MRGGRSDGDFKAIKPHGLINELASGVEQCVWICMGRARSTRSAKQHGSKGRKTRRSRARSSALPAFPTQQPLGNGLMLASVNIVNRKDKQEHTCRMSSEGIDIDVHPQGSNSRAIWSDSATI
eukprot:829599-Pelagomonas_calceolata.AAC.5